MTPEQLKALAIQEKTQVNVRLPSGEIIPAGLNPGEAATLDVFSALTANRQVNVQNAPQLSSALTQVGIQQLGGLPQQPQDPGGVQFLFGRNEQIPELGQILGVSAQRPGLTAGGGAEDIASQFRGVRPVTDTFVNPNKDFFSPQQTSSVTTLARPSPTAIQDLQGSVAITAIEKRIDDIASRLSAGIAVGGAEEILTGLFERFDIKSETDLLNSYNQIILEKTQQLRSLPEDIQKSLEDVGVSEGQLNRLVQKESQKPLEVLRDLMELKGVAQERIDQSLKFVGLFADAQMQDKAAKLEALKFELELAQGKFEDLREDQKDLINQAINTREDMLKRIDQAQRDGAPADVIAKMQAATTEEELIEASSQFYAQQGAINTAANVAPGLARQIEGMSDTDALSFLKQQAAQFGVDVNTLINAVEAEEARNQPAGGGGTVKITPEDTRILTGAGFSPQDINQIVSDVNEFGVPAVLENTASQVQKQAIQKVFNVQALVTREQIEQSADISIRQGKIDAVSIIQNNLTENEIEEKARDAGFSSLILQRVREKDLDKFFESSEGRKLAQTLYIQLLIDQYTAAGLFKEEQKEEATPFQFTPTSFGTQSSTPVTI